MGKKIGDWEYKGNDSENNSPLWDEWVNVKTGESTLKTITPKEVPSCKNHYLEYIDNNGNYQCRNCFVGGRVILAYNQIVDGKMTKIALKN